MFGRKRHRPDFNFQQVNQNHFAMGSPYMRGGYFNQPIRQQAMPYYPQPIGNWNPYLQSYPGNNHQPIHPGNFPFQGPQNQVPNPYPAQQFPGYNQYSQYGQQIAQNNYPQNIFQNPLVPEEAPYSPNSQSQPYATNPYMNPYPKQSFIPKQPSGVQSIMNSFKSQDGSFDMNKMMNTAGSMMNAVTQVSSMVKGLGGMFKV
ncbi:hypothetical protein BGM26_08675 [Bacillus sp. FJAT-29790]|uniref:YppG family protein n=1 Tax=Bacillus sp. FJAT-29790 TaxID=1895002 RepID=UPI001C224E5B|nr:YppG family protein [Bacillus sp. FJAT-29790]MBU8879056.1 hypothetical protein [Bacillus sp. FJAT-29790]